MDELIVTDQVTPLPATGAQSDRTRHFAWIDVRGLDEDIAEAVVDAAIHQRVDGIVSDSIEQLAALPPTMRRVLVSSDPDEEWALDAVDVLIADPDTYAPNGSAGSSFETGAHVVVSDAPTLALACDLVRRVQWTLLTFTDPTKIPLEIVIAAGENSGGRIITTVTDIEDAEIVKLVLEHGSDGVVLSPRSADDVVALQGLITHEQASVRLDELTVEEVDHIGLGERACIDTCSLLELDEGCLIGSFASGFFLSCSETHPLPYMPTRPFRWNAGAVHSYVLGTDNRTRYVSELRAGHPILAVRTDGTAREVLIGRVKIERRPLISITAVTEGGERVNVIAQDDWHVRLLGPGGTVNNVTELRPGDKLLGHVPSEKRHVGLPITEFCIER